MQATHDSAPDPRRQHMKIRIIKATPFGPVALVWTMIGDRPTITRVLLSQPRISVENQLLKQYSNVSASSCAEIETMVTAIKAFLEGEDIHFTLDLVDLSLCSEFQQVVLRAEHKIPWGSVSTYQLIAAYLGKPHGARAVGKALANNPFPLIVPCHRAIRSDGYLGGYQGGLAMKRALLEKEGITVNNVGRLVCPGLHYKKNLSNQRTPFSFYHGLLDVNGR